MSPRRYTDKTHMPIDEVPNLTQLSPGIYADPVEPDLLIIHLGELIETTGLDDTQETRAAIYGAWNKYTTENGVELILVQELNALSVHSPVV